MRLVGPGLTLEESREAMLPWIPFGEPLATEQQLDSFLAKIKADPLDFGGAGKFSLSFSRSLTDSAGVKYRVEFESNQQRVKPLRLGMGIAWPRTYREGRFTYDVPIPPPPGYESVSMEAPPDFGPDSSAKSRSGLPPVAVKPPPPSGNPAVVPPAPPKEGISLWIWLSALLWLLLAWVLYKFRKR